MKKKIISIFLILSLVFSVVCSASSDKECEELKCREGLAVNKIWTINFKTELDSQSIQDNITVLDNQNNEVNVVLELDESNEKVRVIPENNYTFNNKYTLVINEAVMGKNRKKVIRRGMQMPFITNGLAVVGTRENLFDIFDTLNKKEAIYDKNKSNEIKGNNMITEMSNKDQNEQSKTNNQVAEVDEGDIIKTDGKYIYCENKIKEKLRIIKANSQELEEISSIYYGKNFILNELYIEKNYLIAVGLYKYKKDELNKQYSIKQAAPSINSIPTQIYNFTTKALIYDITDKKSPKKVREFEIDGRYSLSRKIGSKLYLIANEYTPDYGPYSNKLNEIRPSFRDSINGNKLQYVEYNNIYYVPGGKAKNYITIATIEIGEDKDPDLISLIGTTKDIYMNENNLYITIVDKKYKEIKAGQSVSYEEDELSTKTNIYKFKLNNGKVDFLKKGVVQGEILNQFSMDEYNDVFRVASTRKKLVNEENVSFNDLYVLDSNMELLGKIEGIAPGEEIKSIRFLEDRAYLTTLGEADTLYTIDLKEVTNPKVIGSLKTSGYINYLQVYDKDNIIGIGKDTSEIVKKDENGNVLSTELTYSGMKMTMFDVRDMTEPKEKFSVVMGERGTESEALKNHRALIFLKDKNIIAFPITVTKLHEKVEDENLAKLIEGKVIFQGMYVYKIDNKKGFELRGQITHLSDKEYSELTNSFYYGEKRIDRAVYIDNNIYTISNSIIKVNDLNTMEEKRALNLK